MVCVFLQVFRLCLSDSWQVLQCPLHEYGKILLMRLQRDDGMNPFVDRIIACHFFVEMQRRSPATVLLSVFFGVMAFEHSNGGIVAGCFDCKGQERSQFAS